MKTLIAAILIVAANSAAATGFSPWSTSHPGATNAPTTNVEVAAPGFAPWRERHVTDEVRLAPKTGMASNNGQANVFRPWS
tara:strand:+ start:5492 stop:5734 length:243 start_codon:yes stop_codon:yes gene_type:complete